MTNTNTREIKFRAWDGLNKTMSFWTMNDLCNHTEESDKPSCLEEWMLYTGLADKNGKEIYEGDLMLTDDVYHDYEDGVAINALPDGKIYPVEHRDGAFFAGDELLYEVATASEIIGNVYENSDLLNHD